ncbi:distal tail protein Dit [Metabacillus crassostreae]|uniref:distal tail protein Dit n=1 Tax=Metabacillus crassostreae TaxID=929098 RepID=UPI001EF8F7EE|nr:distal tail protein Dit [Metabacillus crassostreae]
MSFNGQRQSYLKVLKGRERPAWAPIEHELIEVPGRPGAYKKSKRIKVRRINVPVVIKGADISDLQKLKEDLAAWLITDDPKPLVFDDEPDRVYYAEVTGSFDAEEIVTIGTGIISFICTDPFKYGPLYKGVFESEVATVNAKGTKETFPIFRATVKNPITFMDIVTDEAYMRIGESVDLENEVPFVQEEMLLWDQCNSLVGWSNASAVDGGIVAGTMVTDGVRFVASGYGTGSAWHGPAIKATIPNGPLTDFRLDSIITLGNGLPHQVGRVEIYLLDSSGNVVAKLAMKDTYSGTSLAFGEVRLGDLVNKRFLISEYGDRKGNWNNFYGMLRLQRIGNKWTAYIAQMDSSTNRHHTRREIPFVDGNNQFNKTVSQIVVHVAQYGTNASGTLAINDIKAFRINQKNDTQIAYIANAGDTIEIDHAKNRILINGEDRKDLKDFGASFFALKPSTNNIQVAPYSSFENVEVEWRARYR